MKKQMAGETPFQSQPRIQKLSTERRKTGDIVPSPSILWKEEDDHRDFHRGGDRRNDDFDDRGTQTLSTISHDSDRLRRFHGSRDFHGSKVLWFKDEGSRGPCDFHGGKAMTELRQRRANSIKAEEVSIKAADAAVKELVKKVSVS